jgi:hypothetical protein
MKFIDHQMTVLLQEKPLLGFVLDASNGDTTTLLRYESTKSVSSFPPSAHGSRMSRLAIPLQQEAP